MATSAETKICTDCGRRLPLERFALDRSKRLGVKNRCKSCTSTAARARYRELAERDGRRQKPRDGRGVAPTAVARRRSLDEPLREPVSVRELFHREG